MSYGIYPNSVPEFRIVRKKDGTQETQVRYVNMTQGYIGKWQNVPVIEVKEEKLTNEP